MHGFTSGPYCLCPGKDDCFLQTLLLIRESQRSPFPVSLHGFYTLWQPACISAPTAKFFLGIGLCLAGFKCQRKVHQNTLRDVFSSTEFGPRVKSMSSVYFSTDLIQNWGRNVECEERNCRARAA
jgi:hypothetical protein